MRRYRLRRRSRRRYGRSSKRYFRPSRTFRKKTRRVIYGMSELKQVSTSITANINTGFSFIRFMPQVTQGPGDNQRIGNRIRARYFTMKVEVGVDGSAAPGAYSVRLYIVWPRKLSDNDAQSVMTSINFPLETMPDQDRWIFWKDYKFSLSNTGIYGSPKERNLTFYKRYPVGLSFGGASNVYPEKMPYIIWNTDAPGTATGLVTIRGYIKVSYKDI
nr:Cap [Kummerowia striata CRESS virus]